MCAGFIGSVWPGRAVFRPWGDGEGLQNVDHSALKGLPGGPKAAYQAHSPRAAAGSSVALARAARPLSKQANRRSFGCVYGLDPLFATADFSRFGAVVFLLLGD